MSAIVLLHRKLMCHSNWPMQGCPLKMTTFRVNICPSTYMFILSACQGNLNMNIYVITIRPNGVHPSWLDNDHDKGRLTGLRTMHQRDNRVKYDSPAGWMVNIYICVYICIVLVFVWKKYKASQQGEAWWASWMYAGAISAFTITAISALYTISISALSTIAIHAFTIIAIIAFPAQTIIALLVLFKIMNMNYLWHANVDFFTMWPLII